MISNFRKLVQVFELKRIGGAPKGHQFAPLVQHIVSQRVYQVVQKGIEIIEVGIGRGNSYGS
jgi:hypothetical protein